MKIFNYLDNSSSKINKIDIIIITIMVFFYGILSFYRLGDFKVPSTYKSFKKGESYVLSLKEEDYVQKIRYYTGNNIGKFSVYYSLDGEMFEKINDFSVDEVFAWKDFEVNTSLNYIKFVSKTSNSSLGDLQLYGLEDKKISVIESDGALLDELELVPVKKSFMNSTYFDEIYYARTAYEYVHGIDVYEWTHPPLGKLIMTIPVYLFGFSPFTYRLMGNIFGILLIPIMYLLCKKLFMSSKWALVGASLMMFDSFHFVHTRIALIDGFQITFILLSVLFMKYYIDLDKGSSFKKRILYLFLSGLFIGCAIATKWNALYAALGLAIIFFIHFFKSHYSVKDMSCIIGICIVSFVIVPIIIYTLSYILFPKIDTYKNIFDITVRMWDYHSKLQAGHPFSSNWYEWPIMLKPVWFYCSDVENNIRMTIVDIGNPAIWWFGILTFIFVVMSSFVEKDKNNIFILIFILCTYIPYIFVGRVMFMYHFFITLPFIMLGIVSFLKWITNILKNDKFLLIYLGIVIVLFILFYPVVAGFPVSEGYIRFLKWFPCWYF